ncbi:MAG: tRNA-dihydrouridine synthase [Candidatus Woesearchaeota archaeon]|jgi:nifR3 family TIM-barrel protein
MTKLPMFKSKVFLAPMAGITDPAFRLLCLEQGAGLVITELTSIHAIVAKEKIAGKEEMLDFVSFSGKEHPIGIQLFGSNIEETKKAVELVEPYFDIIDFNIGCPAQHITAQMAGAALLDKPEHMEKLLSTLVSSTNKPVSIKMRSGVTKNNKLFLRIGKIAEDVGVSMVALHPRTVEQGYSGNSDWTLIKELKEKISVPVIGNGDIRSPIEAKQMFEETGCDYIMIGRAAMGNPFIFKQVNNYLLNGTIEEISLEKKKNEFLKYATLTEKYVVPFPNIKSQAMYFTRGLVGGAQLRTKISKTKTVDEIRDLF